MPANLLLKIGLFVFLIGTVFYINHYHINIDPMRIQAAVLSFGIWAPLIYILLFSLRPFVLFPASVFAVAGGLAFGPFLGPVVTYAGSLTGAILSFLLVRRLGSRFIQKSWRGRGKHIQKKIEDNGFFYITALRIIPVINFDFVSYLSALSRIPFNKYLAGTMVGIIPGTLAFNFLGASFAELNARMLAVTALLFAVFLGLPAIVLRLLKKKNIDVDFTANDKQV
ncbi:TVP38/TMEM64 family protein [Salipaludibacillus sp. CUR1]|uniref:TVP38/TMEM64 family protein n=1 Tax=Salipaludibacillus sp. CUR1 TaxID=2820003 RepID=UPI001E3E32E4|nr:TVP38/TMEM64 family protein [Salipaludibacillus sp. CUR1]MCE7792007.1 TVP38/TMEM64 family protein [Salipaludibacillus sp. CUR1]